MIGQTEVNLMNVVRNMKIKVVVKGQREARIRIKLGVLLVQLAATVMRCGYTVEIYDADKPRPDPTPTVDELTSTIDELKAEQERLIAALVLSDGSSGWAPRPDPTSISNAGVGGI